MYVHISVYTHAFYICMDIFVHVCGSLCVSFCLPMHVSMCVHSCIGMLLDSCVCIYKFLQMLFIHLCMHISAWIHKCVSMPMCVDMHVFVTLCVITYVSMFVSEHSCTCVFECVCGLCMHYVFICVCTYILMYLYICACAYCCIVFLFV